MPALEIRNLTKTYANGTTALQAVDLTIADGDFFALLGANGAGKTTLIGILCGLVTKTSGRASVCGYDLDRDLQEVKSCIGVVPQEFNFSIFDKVIDIVVTQAGLYGMPRSQAQDRAQELLTALGLWEKREQTSRALSGGMKRRLMIVRALMHKPRVLLLDEPTAGVDVELRHGMWEYLTTLNAHGTTILLTTHYLEEVERLCRNVAILRHGVKVRDGSVKELLKASNREAYRVTLDRDPAALSVDGFTLSAIDTSTADVEVERAASITALVKAVEAAGAQVLDIRPAANRMEKIFLETIGSDL